MVGAKLLGSGQQLRQDDPSALKEIIGMVKIKMQGVDPTTMKSVFSPPPIHLCRFTYSFSIPTALEPNSW